MALFLAFVFSHSAIIISPFILRLTGLAQPSDVLHRNLAYRLDANTLRGSRLDQSGRCGARLKEGW